MRIHNTTGLFAVLVGLSAASAQRLSAASPQQGTANAVVTKIPSASIPSTVVLSTPGGNGIPGQNVTIPFTLSFGGNRAPSTFQIDLIFDVTKLTFVSASAGAPLTGAGKGILSTEVASGDVRLSTTGNGQTVMSTGVVAYASFAMNSSFGTAGTPVTLVNCKSGDALGNPLSTGCIAGTVGVLTCDVTGDGSVGVADVQTMINEALGVAPAVHDMNRDGAVDVADVQKVVAAAMGGTCAM